jgi:DNA repair protein RecN (Recombination protein N)
MALRRLYINDFVILAELDVACHDGFTALTGETGAGKSILIDALQLVLGQRADSDVLRPSATRCELAASFDPTPATQAWLDDNGYATDEALLLLRRVIDAHGRSRGFINGGAATMAQLRELGTQLVDIHGQHAWQSLAQPAAQRALLDGYGGVALADLHASFDTWQQHQQALEQAQQAQAQLAERREGLAWRLAELDKLAPQPNEWQEINQAHTRLSHAQGLQQAAAEAAQSLDEDDTSALVQLDRAIEQLSDQQAHEPRFAALIDALNQARALTADAAHEAAAYARRVDLDPQGLQALDERLAQWHSLARRLRLAPEALPQTLAAWQAELAQLTAAADLNALQAAEQQAQQRWQVQAQQVSRARQAAAQALGQQVTQAMQGLGMPGGLLQVACTTLAQPQRDGQDKVEFLFAPHQGAEPKPVARIASGGELSRVALAVSVCTSRLGTAPTLIFDEVDAGIGGQVAHTVGQLMRQLGADRQVLAVTHLAQVAANAHQHWLVQKQPGKRRDGAGVSSQLVPLDAAARVTEVARMLGGDADSATSQAHAAEMLRASEARA